MVSIQGVNRNLYCVFRRRWLGEKVAALGVPVLFRCALSRAFTLAELGVQNPGASFTGRSFGVAVGATISREINLAYYSAAVGAMRLWKYIWAYWLSAVGAGWWVVDAMPVSFNPTNEIPCRTFSRLRFKYADDVSSTGLLGCDKLRPPSRRQRATHKISNCRYHILSSIVRLQTSGSPQGNFPLLDCTWLRPSMLA